MDPVASGNPSNLGREISKSGGDELGKDDFMLLLIKQFEYQDPLNPMDDKEFIAQLAQFSSLEQMQQLNVSMTDLTSASRENQLLSATSFIGKTVIGEGNSISIVKDEPIPTYQYGTGESMAKGIIKVYNVSNELVYTEPMGAKQGGIYDFDWEGKTMTGSDAPEGVYFVQVEAYTSEGKPLQIAHQVSGIVGSINQETGQLILGLTDGRAIPLYAIREVTTTKDAEEDSGESEDYLKDPALEKIGERMATYTADAIKKIEDKTWTKDEAKIQVEAKLNEGAVEVRAWADKSLDDRKYTRKEVREMVDRQHKNFTELYAQVDEHA